MFQTLALFCYLSFARNFISSFAPHFSNISLPNSFHPLARNLYSSIAPLFTDSIAPNSTPSPAPVFICIRSPNFSTSPLPEYYIIHAPECTPYLAQTTIRLKSSTLRSLLPYPILVFPPSLLYKLPIYIYINVPEVRTKSLLSVHQ